MLSTTKCWIFCKYSSSPATVEPYTHASYHLSDINLDYEDMGFIHFSRTKNKMERIEFPMPRTKQALLDWKAHLEKVRKKKGIRNPKSFKTQVRVEITAIGP